ncbi:hypothetical protein [Flintibacter muris]|uniref:hypothetical protein n=1 Tax=Flintibacter muris TaxID=2941327 RepID=UPI00203F8B13|nr:hypothetical protein [Flintibacter muris]
MWKTFQKLVKLNLDDLFLYLGVEGGLFLVVQVIIGCVMYFGRPDTSITVSCAIFPIVGGLTALVAGIAHVGVSFDQALRFGQTRKRALGLTLGLTAFQSAFALVLAALLAAVERLFCPSLWVKLAGMSVWVQARSGVMQAAPAPDTGKIISGRFFENMAGELVPLPEKTLLIVGDFTLDWYWWLLIFAVSIAGGIIVGALIQRFGAKGGWIIWGICMGSMFLGQILPWRTQEITNWLFPMLAVMCVAGFLWSIWSLLHAVVRS